MGLPREGSPAAPSRHAGNVQVSPQRGVAAFRSLVPLRGSCRRPGLPSAGHPAGALKGRHLGFLPLSA